MLQVVNLHEVYLILDSQHAEIVTRGWLISKLEDQQCKLVLLAGRKHTLRFRLPPHTWQAEWLFGGKLMRRLTMPAGWYCPGLQHASDDKIGHSQGTQKVTCLCWPVGC